MGKRSRKRKKRKNRKSSQEGRLETATKLHTSLVTASGSPDRSIIANTAPTEQRPRYAKRVARVATIGLSKCREPKVDHHKFREDLLPKLDPQSASSIHPKWSNWWNQPDAKRMPVSWGIVGFGCFLLLSLGSVGVIYGFVGLSPDPSEVISDRVPPAFKEGGWIEVRHDEAENEIDSTEEVAVQEPIIPTIEQALLEARSEDVEAARDVLWRFVVATNPEDRIAHTLRPEANAPHIIAHHARNPGLAVGDVRIETMRAWDGPTGLNVAFKVLTDYNRRGCVVEVVCTKEKEYKVSWQRFVQHHYGTFRQFFIEKTDDEQRFYLTAMRRHVMESDALPSWIEVDSYAISGTNPNNYVTAYVRRSGRVADRLKAGVPWATRNTIKAELQWRSNPDVPEERFLFIEDFLASGWGGDLYE